MTNCRTIGIVIACLAFWAGGFLIGRTTAVAPTEPDTDFDFVPVELPSFEAPRSAESPTPTLAPAVEVVRGGDTGFPQWDGVGAERLHPLPTPAPRVEAGGSPTPRASAAPQPVSHVPAAGPIRGTATWYDAPPGQAAAGPVLRKALGKNWRGKTVQVCVGGRCVTAKLSDWCACGPRHGVPTLLDLDDRLFAQLAPLSRGVIAVTVRH